MYYEPTSKFGAWANQTFGVKFFDRVTKLKVHGSFAFMEPHLNDFSSLKSILVPERLVASVEEFIPSNRIAEVKVQDAFNSEIVLK